MSAIVLGGDGGVRWHWATQLALVTPPVLQSLMTLATWVIPEAPALQESSDPGVTPCTRVWEETLHLEPEF